MTTVESHAADERVRAAVVQTLMRRGFHDRVMAAGSELDRLKEYLGILTGRRAAPPAPAGMAPTIFPPFPGLDERPWREPTMPAAVELERHAGTVLTDLARVAGKKFFSWGKVPTGEWSVVPIFFAGERVDRLFFPQMAMDGIARLVMSLDGGCAEFPLADVTLSAHAPGTRLPPHCSWDPFRLRLHLGLIVPEGCGIRVHTASQTWQEGRVLAFHDAFEHETWNTSSERRVILIVDCWHPDLTTAEREALLALTRKLEVRTAIAQLRFPAGLMPRLMDAFGAAERDDPLVHRFWRSRPGRG